MKKLGICFLLLALLLGLQLPAMAATDPNELKSETVFHADGSCLVSLSLTLYLDGSEDWIEIPLPAQATDILVGDARQFALQTYDDQTLLQIAATGEEKQMLTVQYALDGLFVKDRKNATVTLPILSGLHYSIEQFRFSITLPDRVFSKPMLESGYYQQNVEEILTCTFDGTTFSGTNKVPLKDRETLVMTLQVPKDYFRDPPRTIPLPNGWDVAIFCLVFLAAVYFFLCLLPKSPDCSIRPTAPDGIHAGDVGTVLTGCGTDLTMLVLSWAQMGYILIEMDHKNRVTLHKRMDMGNERSAYEVRWFKSLFGQRNMIDADSYHYAKLCRKLAGQSPIRNDLYDKRSGNPMIFRILSCIAGSIVGLRLGLELLPAAGAKALLGILLACLCCVFSFLIQSGGKCLPLREKKPLWTALGCGLIWIILGRLTGDLHHAIPMVFFQFLAGIAAAYGGKRSELGLRYMGQIRGMRRHMTTSATFDLQQILQNNPNYYYELAPFALALGVDRNFARRFGKATLPEDSYVQCGAARELTAIQFAIRLRKVADILNARQKRLPYEQLRGK